MTVGLVHFDNMDPLCNSNDLDNLANALDMEKDNLYFSCFESRRCCSRCTLPLPSGPTKGTHPVVVGTHDELRTIFRRGLGIMVVALIAEMLVGIIVACSIHGQEVVVGSYQEDPKEELDFETVVKIEKSLSRWRRLSFVCTVIGAVVLITDMCLLIALVLVPAVPHLRNLSCIIYVVMYGITALATYACIGVLIDRYIAISSQRYRKHSCMDTCICKAVLKIMGACMWLVIICSLIVGAIYCAIFATNRD